MGCINVRLLRIDTKLRASVFYKNEGFSAKVRLTCVAFPDAIKLYAADGQLLARDMPLFVSGY